MGRQPVLIRSASPGPPAAGVVNWPTAVVNAPKLIRLMSTVAAMRSEIRHAELDEPARRRLADSWSHVVDELSSAAAPDTVHELRQLVATDLGEVPTDGELRILHAQLAGWLEGLLSSEAVASWRAAVPAGTSALAQQPVLGPPPAGPPTRSPSPYL